MSFSNKIALVTGGSRGLGKDTAITLAKKGSDVIITYVSNKDAADKTLSQISELGKNSAALQLDVSNSASFNKFKNELNVLLKDKWNKDKIDFLINNAGTGSHSMISETTVDEFDSMINIHLKGPYFLTQKLMPIISDGGRIVNLSTGLSRFAFPGYAAYASAKGAVEIFTKYLAKEVGARKITANVVAPGAIDNDFNKDRFDAFPQVKEIIASNTAMGRVGVSEDIGSVVSFLCSEDAGWISGQRIEASGGMFL